MEFFDTHAHLDDDALKADRAGVLARAAEAKVVQILAVGTTAESSLNCAALAQSEPMVLASAGIHPNHITEAKADDWDEIVALSQRQEVVALGETGLDLYWKDTPLAQQQDYFDRHLRLSQQTGLPVIIHQRESAAEILVMLREARQRGPLAGVMHSFTADQAVAAECLELGLHISFAGMVTFKNAPELRELARTIPAHRLLIETDSPYLTPHPHRGKRPNEPALVVHTAACLAEVRGQTLGELAAQTTANARDLFRPADQRLEIGR
jgi:TatD DNase family protein